MKRTGAIVILTIVSVVAGLVAIFDVLRYLRVIGTPLDFFVAAWFGALLSGLVALIWFSTARQIWNGDPRGWLFMVSISVILRTRRKAVNYCNAKGAPGVQYFDVQ